ncbi:SRPBCC domain-containing protein [Cryptosporangium sp. NPDC048952]|uniref:SRPBCC family protein n=1 Tax=Cryptosporangium sp. NPDC048952 TaxID=3363961 RepID=UPI00371FEFF2
MTAAIHVDEFLPHPPAAVWHALTDPEALNAWFLPSDFKPVVGHRFQLQAEPIEATKFSGVIACEVLELRPEELLSYSWTDANNAGGLDSVVTWTLRPEGTGTRLFVEHSGFDLDDPQQKLAHTIMDGGWRSQVLRRLIQHLEAS